MKNTKIEYCTHTWNPVSGCQFQCRYCFASGVARRFGAQRAPPMGKLGRIHCLNEPVRNQDASASAYPYGFDPTFFRYRLHDYQNTAPANIFVCSTGDLFGEWIPDAWLVEVFRAALDAPQHNYIFLTKKPMRYHHLPFGISHKHRPANMFFGATVATRNDTLSLVQTLQEYPRSPLNFLSVEPILEDIDLPELLSYHPDRLDWVIVGMETGNAPGKIYPDRKWVEELMVPCYKHGIPIFMKSGEEDYMPFIMASEFLQEYPPQLLKNITDQKKAR